MGQIKVLDRNMVNMIAAGEVIERPASVVKELMENSIDAVATKITVSIEDGGRKLISIADNGGGMSAEDLAAAFEPHTTSKIKTTKDLRGISTLGFRGEALASIASVAQVRAVSRTQTEVEANCIEIDCGSKGGVSPASADYGTTIQVRDLFYKLPARRKFLKTANTEMTHITEHFTRFALSNCHLDMMLTHNGKVLYRLSPSQGLRERIAELFSPEIAENLLEIESNEKGLDILALLGKPGISRTNRKFQYVFVNGRFIRDKFISHAIKEAYRGCLEPDRYPVVFLFVKAAYEDIDVNVHPTKVEVRFYNSNLVHSQILGCLREKLLQTNLDVSAKLPTSASPLREQQSASEGGYRNQKIAEAMADFFRKHRPIPTQQQFQERGPSAFARERAGSAAEATYQKREIRYEGPQANRKFIQIHDSVIVTEDDDGFIIIDQHALHERIIYEDLCRRIRESKLESQRLLIPESFKVTASQANAIETNSDLIEKLGIELLPFAPRTMAVQAFPTLLARAIPIDFVQDLIDLLDRKDVNLDAERLLDEVLKMAACKAAIKAGQKLSNNEIEHLLAGRDAADISSRCPHGRPAVIKFSLSDLQKQFKRT